MRHGFRERERDIGGWECLEDINQAGSNLMYNYLPQGVVIWVFYRKQRVVEVRGVTRNGENSAGKLLQENYY